MQTDLIRTNLTDTNIDTEFDLSYQISNLTTVEIRENLRLTEYLANNDSAASRYHFRFDRLGVRHARQMAKLHIEGIKRGFISSLGLEFVTALYEAIAESEAGFGFVTDDDKVLGFVAFSTDLGKLYKSVIRKRGLKLAFLLAGKMLSFKRIKKVFETLFYPNKTEKMDLPTAELLSIVVAPEARRKHRGSELINKGFEELQRRGIDKVKVFVGANNTAANKLYQRCGFELSTRIENHGLPCNIYVAKTKKAQEAGKTAGRLLQAVA